MAGSAGSEERADLQAIESRIPLFPAPFEPAVFGSTSYREMTAAGGESRRRILGESEMCLVDLVVGDEIGEQQPQLPIGQDDDLIERLPANGGDEALGDPALPRAEAGPGGRHAHEPKC